MMIATLRHPRSSSLPLDNSLSQPFSSHSISDVAKGVTLSPQHHGNTLQPCTLGPQGPGKVEECGKHSGCATWPDGWIKWQLEETHTHMCFHTLTHAYINTCTNVQHIVFSKVLINIKTLEPKGNLFTQKHTNTQTCDTYKSAPIRV